MRSCIGGIDASRLEAEERRRRSVHRIMAWIFRATSDVYVCKAVRARASMRGAPPMSIVGASRLQSSHASKEPSAEGPGGLAVSPASPSTWKDTESCVGALLEGGVEDGALAVGLLGGGGRAAAPPVEKS